MRHLFAFITFFNCSSHTLATTDVIAIVKAMMHWKLPVAYEAFMLKLERLDILPIRYVVASLLVKLTFEE